MLLQCVAHIQIDAECEQHWSDGEAQNVEPRELDKRSDLTPNDRVNDLSKGLTLDVPGSVPKGVISVGLPDGRNREAERSPQSNN